MKRFSFQIGMLAIVVSGLLLSSWTVGDNQGKKGEWSQWRGPNRDGISSEKINKQWPKSGPAVLWKNEIGSGFSGMSVAGGKIYTMYEDGESQYAVSMNAGDGKEIWKVALDKTYPERQGGDGPRTTPIVSGGRVYTMTAFGKLFALNQNDGSTIWSHDLQSEYGAQMPIWGFSGTPILEDGLIMMDVGGKSGHSVMAFKASDGSVAWKAETDQPGYSSPVIVTVDGVRQALFFTGTKLVSVDPKNGKKYWEYKWKTDWFVNSATPILLPGGRVFISSNYGTGGAVLQIEVNGNNVTVTPVWQNKEMKNHMASCVYLDGYLYGFDDATLKCVDAKTGKEMWKKRGFGKGTVLLADGHLIVLADNGQLVLAKATAEAFTQVADAGKVVTGRCWTVPTLVDGKLYVRSLKEAACLDVGEGSVN